jgi:hypothetical protein
MIAQSLIKSGYHIEFLMTAEYIRSILLTLFETGKIPLYSISEIEDDSGEIIRKDATLLHPPKDLEELRLYEVNTAFQESPHPFTDIVPDVYSIHPDEFQVSILEAGKADIRVKVYPSYIQDIENNPTQLLLGFNAHINIDVKFELVSSIRPSNGLLENIQIKLELIDISGILVNLIEDISSIGMTKEDLMLQLAETINQTLDFPLTAGGAIQEIYTKKFNNVPGKPDAIGVYINLALQNSPEKDSYFENEGDLEEAENFLDSDSAMAFGFNANLYAKLGQDLKFKMAKKREGDSGYYYPLLENGEKVGSIKEITVYPKIEYSGSEASYPNQLIINIYGEYDKADLSPDFDFQIFMKPIYPNGLLEFEVDYDLDIGWVSYLLTLFLGTFISVVLPQIGIPLTIIAILAMKGIEYVLTDFAKDAVESEGSITSFLDTFPNQLMVEARRWDPLFFTQHRLKTAEAQCLINNEGFAIESKKLKLGITHEPIEHAVIRSEFRNEEEELDGLYYRIRDIGNYLDNDLIMNHAASLRYPYKEILPPEGSIETYRVGLSLSQMEERIQQKTIHPMNLEYVPKKVDIIENQIYKILSISQKELEELKGITRDILRNEINANQMPEIREQAISELEGELGRTPNETEINDRINQIITELIEDNFSIRYQIELDRRMKFQLEPFELAKLQRKNILILGKDHLVIRDMRTENGITTYYRDYEQPFEPLTNKNDNLMNLPKYKADEL